MPGTCSVDINFIEQESNYQGHICDGTSRNSVQESLSQKAANRNGFPEPFFPGIIKLTPHTPTEFWVILKHIFFRKIALVIINMKYRSQEGYLFKFPLTRLSIKQK
jgi:hypothetical protein